MKSHPSTEMTPEQRKNHAGRVYRVGRLLMQAANELADVGDGTHNDGAPQWVTLMDESIKALVRWLHADELLETKSTIEWQRALDEAAGGAFLKPSDVERLRFLLFTLDGEVAAANRQSSVLTACGAAADTIRGILKSRVGR